MTAVYLKYKHVASLKDNQLHLIALNLKVINKGIPTKTLLIHKNKFV